MEVEQDNPEVRQRRLWAPKPKAKAKQVVQQSYDASELRPQHVTNKKDRAERTKEREERKAQMQPQPSTRTRLTKARAQLAGAPPEDLREVCAWLHMAPRRKTMLSASLRRVWRAQREKDEDRRRKQTCPRRGERISTTYKLTMTYSAEVTMKTKMWSFNAKILRRSMGRRSL